MQQLEIPFTWFHLSEEETRVKVKWKYCMGEWALVNLEDYFPDFSGDFMFLIELIRGNGIIDHRHIDYSRKYVRLKDKLQLIKKPNKV